MPCDLSYLREEERRRREAERETAMAEIESKLGQGIVALVRQPDGSFVLEGVETPLDMTDSCVLAALGRRASLEFLTACAMAGTSAEDFVSAHGHGH